MKHILLAAALAAFFVSSSWAQCITPASFHLQAKEAMPTILVSMELRQLPGAREGVEAVVYENPALSTVLVVVFVDGCLRDMQEMSRENALNFMSPGA